MVDPDHVMKGPSQATATSNSIEPTTQPQARGSKGTPERESKLARVKRMLTCQQRTSNAAPQPQASSAETATSGLPVTAAPITYEQAKASVKARKRKERQESITSISQERKVIRSNSEERPTNSKNDIRRVSSHEDFKKSNNKDDMSGISHLHKISPLKDSLVDLECEYEKRRSHERFSRPLVQRNKYNSQGRRPKSKHFSKKDKTPKRSSNNKSDSERKELANSSTDDNEEPCQFLQLHQEEKERSPSPVHTPISPAIDLTTLHQQIDCSEPLPSTSIRQMLEDNESVPSLSMTSNRLLSSPRNSVIITQRIYLNPDIPQTITDISKEMKNPLEQRQKQLLKQISSAKKKIRKYDEDFESRFGYRPSHADKLNDKGMKKLCAELSKLKKEQKQLIEDAALCVNEDSRKIEEEKKAGSMLHDTLHEIEKKLNSKRTAAERSKVIEEMSNEQLIEEKIAVQKALLYLESQHGRPINKEDKDMARPLYDRYRALKRMVARLNMTNSIIELATIHEHETMDFVSLPPTITEGDQPSDSDNTRTSSIQATTLQTSSTTDSSDTDTSIGENLHALTLAELYEQQRTTSEEKKQLRRSLKEFEHEFEERTGKKLQKEDKVAMEEVYQSYKKAKAKLRLLDALVGKQT